MPESSVPPCGPSTGLESRLEAGRTGSERSRRGYPEDCRRALSAVLPAWRYCPVEEFLVSKFGRACLALVMTVMIGVALYRGRTGGRFDISEEESPGGYGCVLLIWSLVALYFWFSLLF